MRKRYELIFTDDHADLHAFIVRKADTIGLSVPAYVMLLTRAVYLEAQGDMSLASLLHPWPLPTPTPVRGPDQSSPPTPSPRPPEPPPEPDLLDGLIDTLP